MLSSRHWLYFTKLLYLTPLYLSKVYVHDPSHPDEQAERRYAGMFMPKSTSNAKARKLTELLRELQDVLTDINPYVKDFLTAAEVFEQEDVANGSFVIDADQRPTDTHRGQYDGNSGRRYNFNEICVLAAEVCPRPLHLHYLCFICIALTSTTLSSAAPLLTIASKPLRLYPTYCGPRAQVWCTRVWFPCFAGYACMLTLHVCSHCLLCPHTYCSCYH